jgi:hypothetical protein
MVHHYLIFEMDVLFPVTQEGYWDVKQMFLVQQVLLHESQVQLLVPL